MSEREDADVSCEISQPTPSAGVDRLAMQPVPVWYSVMLALVLACRLLAMEPIPEVRTGNGAIFRRVKILSIDGDQVAIVYDGGATNLPASAFDLEALARAKIELDAKAEHNRKLLEKIVAEDAERDRTRQERVTAVQKFAAQQSTVPIAVGQTVVPKDGAQRSVEEIKLGRGWEVRSRKGEEQTIVGDLMRIFSPARAQVDLRGNSELFVMGKIPFLASRRSIEKELNLGLGSNAKFILPGFPELSFWTYSYKWDRGFLEPGSTRIVGRLGAEKPAGFETLTLLFDGNDALVAAEFQTSKRDGAGFGVEQPTGFFVISILQHTTRFGVHRGVIGCRRALR